MSRSARRRRVREEKQAARAVEAEKIYRAADDYRAKHNERMVASMVSNLPRSCVGARHPFSGIYFRKHGSESIPNERISAKAKCNTWHKKGR